MTASDNSTPSRLERLVKRLRDKQFRDEYCSAFVRTGIAFQIRALRDQRNWLQKDLVKQSGKPASVISRLENPDYGKFNVQTLLELAAAFDVALLVRFVPFSEFIRKTEHLSPEDYAVPSFDGDTKLYEESQATVATPLEPFPQDYSVIKNLDTFATAAVSSRLETAGLPSRLSPENVTMGGESQQPPGFVAWSRPKRASKLEVN